MIAVYCGESLEKWDPTSLKTGIGGSETAVIHLTRALVNEDFKSGGAMDHKHNIDVFNNPLNAGMSEGPARFFWVQYLDDHSIDIGKKDYEALIVWRHPEAIRGMAGHISAKKKILWLHDMLPELEVLPYIHFYDTIVVSTNFHKEQYPNIPTDKIKVIPLGIDSEEIQSIEATRNPWKLCSFSAYDRGIVVLLESWTKYKLMFPKLELVVGYGWQVLEKIAQDRKDFIWFKGYMEHLFDQEGVTHLGRVSQAEVIRHMKESQLWVYPSVWAETFCLTGIQAQASGAVPVTSTYGALRDTVNFGFTGDNEKIWSERLIHALQSPEEVEAIRGLMVPKTLEDYSWTEVAKKWREIL